MIKKVWKDEEAVSPVIAVILMVAITVVLAAVLYMWAQSFAGDQGTTTAIGWNVGVQGDNYLVQIIDVDPISSQEVGYKVLTTTKLVATIDDPNGDEVRIEGDLDDIKFDQDDFDDADGSTWTDATSGTQFYADYPDAADNSTLYIVWMDTDTNDKLSSGDYVWIRSQKEGGTASDSFIFRLINQQSGSPYGDLTLPATN